MENNKPLIKLFVENDIGYLYDAALNKVIRLPSKELFLVLCKLASLGFEYINEIQNPLLKYQIEKLIRQGYLQNKIKSIEHPYTPYCHSFVNRYVEGITLEITQNCNFKCRYCSFANKNSERSHSCSYMSNEIIKKSIDLYKRMSIDCPKASINFYGGEPLLAVSQIKYAIEYAEKSFSTKPIQYNMTTNASLLSPEIIELLVKKNVNIMISYDGPEEVQNKNRRFFSNGQSTFNVVKKNLEYIEDFYPQYYANNIVINSILLNKSDKERAEKFFENFKLSKHRIRINMANVEHIEFINEDMDFPTRKSEVGENKFEKVLDNCSVVSEICHHSGPCVPGSKKLFISTNGNLYPCEKVNTNNSAYLIGNVFDGFNYDNVKTLLNIGWLSKGRCKNCWAINFCSMCCAQCDGINKLDDEIKKQRCTLLKKDALLYLKQYVLKNNL